MKHLFAVPALALISALPLSAGSIVIPESVTSTDGSITVYETAEFGATYYYVDINADALALQIAGFAVSFHIDGYGAVGEGDIFPSFSASLGATDAISNGSGLAAGTYHQSSWPGFFPVSFEEAFGTADNGFIWISGANPITIANDLDGGHNAYYGNHIASRLNIPNSEFVAFGTGNTLLAGSLVPEPTTALLSCTSLLVLFRRRR